MKAKVLFGGDDGWKSADWTASDDSVRGGKSQSHLTCDGDTARFHGNLDTQTLGGAGFASQRTTSDDLQLDLSDYAGIQLCIEKGDDKRYTFILKDDLQSPDITTGREKSTVSFECDFDYDKEDDQAVFIPWDAFTATYRGKPQKDAGPLNRKKIKRVSVMCRSFFDVQHGDFSITFKSICALPEAPPPTVSPLQSANVKADARLLEEGTAADGPIRGQHAGWIGNASTRLINDHPRATYAVIGLATLLVLYARYYHR